jgi:hypothetical protein
MYEKQRSAVGSCQGRARVESANREEGMRFVREASWIVVAINKIGLLGVECDKVLS